MRREKSETLRTIIEIYVEGSGRKGKSKNGWLDMIKWYKDC